MYPSLRVQHDTLIKLWWVIVIKAMPKGHQPLSETVLKWQPSEFHAWLIWVCLTLYGLYCINKWMFLHGILFLCSYYSIQNTRGTIIGSSRVLPLLYGWLCMDLNHSIHSEIENPVALYTSIMSMSCYGWQTSSHQGNDNSYLMSITQDVLNDNMTWNCSYFSTQHSNTQCM